MGRPSLPSTHVSMEAQDLSLGSTQVGSRQGTQPHQPRPSLSRPTPAKDVRGDVQTEPQDLRKAVPNWRQQSSRVSPEVRQSGTHVQSN